jgi:hypothetical protein
MTFAQQRNRLTTHFLESIPVVKRRMAYFLMNCIGWSGRGPGSSVGIAAGYGLHGPGIESQWGPALGPTQPPVQWVPALSRG